MKFDRKSHWTSLDSQSSPSSPRSTKQQSQANFPHFPTQSALLANVLTSTGSWPNLLPPGTATPWPVRTCWFSGIAFALASVLTAADQTIRLHRMAGHRHGLALIRRSLRTAAGANGRSGSTHHKYRPRPMQVYAWQLGVLFLGATVGCIVAGMVFLVWSAMVDDLQNGRGFGDNGKVCSVIMGVWAVTRKSFVLTVCGLF